MSRALRVSLLIVGVGGVGVFLLLLWQFKPVASQPVYGATFSPAYARFLGLDPYQVLPAMLAELPLQQIRVPIHWDEIQPAPKQARLDELDWIMAEAAKHDVGVILAIGNKVPRWPECYTPDWAEQLPEAEYEQALLEYIDLLVTRYRSHRALLRWQVENEALFPFGVCPQINYALVKQEIDTVRNLDPEHPIQLTVSGEQQLWATQAKDADVIGASMYRKVALPNGWMFTFPIPARLYALQALSISWFVDATVISELQAEPWLTQDYRDYSLEEAAALFTPVQLQTYLRYAQRTGLTEISLWGVEWWYYLKQNGQPDLWNAGVELLKTKN